MYIKVLEENGTQIVVVDGRLDTVTSPELENAVLPLIEAGKTIIMDCASMEYISSAGLRVVLLINKHAASTGGHIIIRNLSKEVRSVFDMTGFSRLVRIE